MKGYGKVIWVDLATGKVKEENTKSKDKEKVRIACRRLVLF